MSLGGGMSTALDTAVANSIASGVSYASRRATRTRTPATPRRPASPAPSRSARRRAPTPARRSPTSARASTSSRRARASPRPGARATRRRTRSAARRWRRRTSRARSRSTCRRTRRASPATAAAALIANSTPNKVTNAGSGSPNRLLYSIFGGGGGGDNAAHDVHHLAGRGSTVSGTVTSPPMPATPSASPGSSSTWTARSSAPTRPRRTDRAGTRRGSNGGHGLQTKPTTRRATSARARP